MMQTIRMVHCFDSEGNIKGGIKDGHQLGF